MSDQQKAWAFVVVQFALLGGLWLTPVGDLWSRPSALLTAADVAFWSGIAGAGLGALWLRRALTPLPIPTPRGELCTTGPFRWSRHPIYLGLLVSSTAMVVRRANATAIVLAIALVLFFSAKARWEERFLLERYDGYARYARNTGRILPGVGRLRTVGEK